MENEFSLKKYDSIDDIVLASFKIEDESFTMEDLKNSTQTGLDSNENEIEFTYEQQKSGIESQGLWGWVDESKVIHFWIGREDISMDELIHFFAHEIGHRMGKADEDDFQEEMRAEGYGRTAILAYKFAQVIKSNV